MGVIDYAWGQCTWFVSHSLNWLGVGTVGALGNADDWLNNAKSKGLPVSSSPTVGSAVVYGAGNGYSGYGHVAVVTAVNPNGTFQVAEDNWGGVGHTNIRTSTLQDVEGFILPPNVQQGVAGATNALHMAGSSGNAAAGGTATTVGHSGGNVATAGFDITNPLGSLFSGFAATVSDWAQRGTIIVFGGLVLLIGLVLLFKTGVSSQGQTVIAGPVTGQVGGGQGASGNLHFGRRPAPRSRGRSAVKTAAKVAAVA